MTTPATSTTGHDADPTPMWQKVLTGIAIIGIIILFILIGMSLFGGKSSPNNENDGPATKSSKSKNVTLILVRRVPIHFKEDYQSDPDIYVKSGHGWCFSDANTDYCGKNKDGEQCGKKGQDIANKLTFGSINTEGVWVRGDGDTGTVYYEEYLPQ